MLIECRHSKCIIAPQNLGPTIMKKIVAIILLSITQSGCLVAAAIDGATDVAIAVVKAPIKVGAAVVDVAVGDEDVKRVYTTVTMLDKSDDLEGGNLVVYNDDGSVVTINLGIGETAIFRSNLVHEATEVIRGTRKVLVAWLF